MLEIKKIISYTIKMFLMLLAISLVFEFVYSLIKTDPLDVAFSKWMNNFTFGRFVGWIIISIIFGIYQVKFKVKKT